MPNLEYLYCSQNPINFINATGLSHLSEIRASSTGITSMSQIMNQGNNVLRLLWLDGNNINNITVSGLPQLEYLSLTYNNLAHVTLSDLPNLMRLDLNNNQLTSVDVSAFPNLHWLFCQNNAFTELDVTHNPLLASLFVESNQLSTLDLSQNHHLLAFDVANNNLTWLNIKNGSNENLHVEFNPDLAYICADESQVSDPALLANSITQINTYCSFSPGGIYYTVAGSCSYDNDSNGCDAQDSAAPSVKFLIADGSTSGTIISGSGNYSVSLTEGNYTLTPVLENQDYFNFSPPGATFSFPETASPFAQNFCITPNGSHPDLEIVLVPLSGSRPGIDTSFKIIYKNKGNQTQSGTIGLTFDDSVLDLVSSHPSVVSQVVNQLTWNFSNLVPFEVRQIECTLNLNSPTEVPPVNQGHILNFTADIISEATDDMPADNTFNLVQTVVNSFDPNDKICLEGTTVDPEMVGQYVHYRIRFENTGTAEAQNIVVKDEIDGSQFDIGSLIPLGGSHDYFTRTTGNKAEFIFENINLPFDDVNNDGYVVFKIKTQPTLSVGDTFSNAASIYFDYNHPIVTDPAVTTISVLHQNDFEFSDHVALYPNPARNELYLQSDQLVTKVSVYNTLGQLVLVVDRLKDARSIDISGLRQGNYFIQVQTDSGISNRKFIKN